MKLDRFDGCAIRPCLPVQRFLIKTIPLIFKILKNMEFRKKGGEKMQEVFASTAYRTVLGFRRISQSMLAIINIRFNSSGDRPHHD